MMEFVRLAGAALIAMTLDLSAARGEILELKFGHVGEAGSLFDQTSREFARIANERLGGRAKVFTFGASKLGGDNEMLQRLKVGTLDFALPSTVMSTEVDLFGIFDMPYLVRDRAHMARIEKEIFWPVLAPAAEKRGYKILAVWEYGFRHITNSKRPIVVPADLQGITLRVPEGKWRIKTFQAYGASPSAMRFSEVFAALQSGVLDGEENSLTQIVSANFQAVQKYLSTTAHLYVPAYVAVGAKPFASLPPDVQKILEETARDVQKFVYATAEREDKESLAKLKAAGMRINEPEKQAFVAASSPVYEEFAKEVPGTKELMDKALQLAKTR